MHLLDSREKYNTQAASLRLRGLTTVHIRRPESSGRRSHAALRMEEVMKEWTEDVTQETIAEDRSAETMDWLVRYMANAWKILEMPHSTGKRDQGPQPKEKEMARCLLCTARPMRPSSITRHYKSKHEPTGIFDDPLSSLRCLASGLKLTIVNGASEFCSHVLEVRGKIHAPGLVFLVEFLCLSGHIKTNLRPTVARYSLSGRLFVLEWSHKN
ncbi:hypothetical protein MMC29_002496 [Sticta canariensis]|nr:hypothetical protein [Sticta canariensis]